MNKLLIERRFRLREWNERSRLKIEEFWAGRGVHFTDVSENKLVGKRGSLLGNLTSFGMERLITTVTIDVSDSNECICALKVDTSFQIIASWNRQFWQLELDTFESFMLHGDNRQAEWASYNAMARRADCRFVLMIIGVIVFITFALPQLLSHSPLP